MKSCRCFSNSRVTIDDGHVGPEDVGPAELDQAALVVLQLEIPLETVYAVVAQAAALGVPVLLNEAESLRATCPALPMPLVNTAPGH